MQDLVAELVQQRLDAYKKCPRDVREHASIEESVLAGRYGYRQIHELVQNGADAISEMLESQNESKEPRRIDVLLTDNYLYVANTGAPISREGVEALLSSHSSPKRGNQIGRFGLGFKSLLRLGGKIDLLGQNFAFQFDPQRCRSELKHKFSMDEAPGLRLAWMLNADQEVRSDRNLENFSWATTVIRAEIQDANGTEVQLSLRKEMEEFPAEFLLFLPASVNLTLSDADDFRRELRREGNQDCQLWEGEKCAAWRVFSKEVRIDDSAAKDDASHIHQRDSVPVSWAVPVSSRRDESGVFWAFFPTQTPSSIAGILNAPWKLDSDRNGLIEGKWNTALMNAAGALISDAIPMLNDANDPGLVLDYFPRQVEAKAVASDLVAAVWKHLQGAACIPDADGVMRVASELRIPPTAKEEIAKTWEAIADQRSRSRMVHSSTLRGNRSSRLTAFARQVSSQPALHSSSLNKLAVADWFGAIATIELDGCRAVLELARAFQQSATGSDWNQIASTLAVIPTTDGTCHSAMDVVIAPPGTDVPGRLLVDSRITEDAECKNILVEVFRTKELDDIQWSRLLVESLRKANQGYSTDKEWLAFWERLRRAPENVAAKFVADHRDEIKVLRNDKNWVRWDDALTAGRVVEPDDTSSNASLLVSSEVHCLDGQLLSLLGVNDLPLVSSLVTITQDSWQHSACHWLEGWRANCIESYRSALSANQRNPQEYYLKPTNFDLPRGWTLLPRLEGEAKARLTRFLLESCPKLGLPATVSFKHKSRKEYPEIKVPHPLPWLLLQHGGFQIGECVLRLDIVVQQFETVASCIPEICEVQRTLKVLRDYQWQTAIGRSEKHSFWDAIFNGYFSIEPEFSESAVKLLHFAAKDSYAPKAIDFGDRRLQLDEVLVTCSNQLASLGCAMQLPVVCVPDVALNVWIENNARRLDDVLSPSWDATLGPTALIEVAFPDLSPALSVDAAKVAKCQIVENLRLEFDGNSKQLPCYVQDHLLYVDSAQLAMRPRLSWLSLLLEQAASAGWLKDTLASAMELVCDRTLHDLRAKVAACSTLTQRLWHAVGRRREPLLDSLGELAHKNFVCHSTDEQLADLVLAQFGPIALSQLRDALEAEGLRPPSRWNSEEAKAFVQSLGFPAEFAASESGRRPAEESISGPVPLPDLHDYQTEVLEGIQQLLTAGKVRRRTVVSLPTGGGKTRVTVQAAVDLFLTHEQRKKVLWIAQTDELCEQAVQAFMQVWINRGAERTYLRIIRMWGGNPLPEKPAAGEPTVVVSSIQTLNSRMSRKELDWLKSVDLVVIDECHHAITKSYSNLLRWLDAEVGNVNAKTSASTDEPVIIGLSATPFRTDEVESMRLARRFDNEWLPKDQRGLHQRLLDRGILANANYESLNYGAGVPASLLRQLEQLMDAGEGIEFENLVEQINLDLSQNDERSEFIVNAIVESPEQSVMVFGNSVKHSKELAARLQLRGVSSAEVSGQTPSTARRYFLKKFQAGDIRVLCNHSVLTTGFDAPRVDMILIARQVFSPVRYMQMVGRGLRGTANGGTSECRIVTILDNLGRFTDKHPYHFCSKYFVARSDP